MRPVYAPALVVFVGGGGIAFGGNVAWFPLGPREVYVPPYRTSPDYVRNLNANNVRDVNRINEATRITNVTNGVLFVIIVLEILTTVVAHFDFGGFQLKPFLIIGIISAVRHILTVGAQESLVGAESSVGFRRAQAELGVNAAVVLALVVGLILVRKTDIDDNQDADVE